MHDYMDFDLRVERTSEGYRAVVGASPAGEAKHDFAMPFSGDRLKIYLLEIGNRARGTRRADPQGTRSAREFGGALFGAVFAGEVRERWRESLFEATERGRGLRLRLRLGDAPELADLPWEYLFDPQGNEFVLLSTGTPLVHYLELPDRIKPLSVPPPLRALVMVASPSDYPALEVAAEWKRLSDALAPVVARGLLQIDRLETGTLSNLQRELRLGEYHILHFIGHGKFDADAKVPEGVLIVEDEMGRGREVTGGDLAIYLRDATTLRLAVLNCCEAARTSPSDIFAGVAPTLVRRGVPAVIAMQFEVSDAAAVVFATDFYRCLAELWPVDASLGEARKALYGAGHSLEWGTPVLYMRASDGRIFAATSSEAPVPPEAPKSVARQASTSAAEPAQIEHTGPTPLGIEGESPGTENGPSRRSAWLRWGIPIALAGLLLVALLLAFIQRVQAARPQLGQPEDDSTVMAGPVTLDWQPTSEAESSDTFRIELGSTSKFTDKVSLQAGASFAPVDMDRIRSARSSDGAVYWRVRAVHVNGTLGPWSRVGHFRAYESAIDHIRSTKRVVVATSATQDDKVFGWRDNGQWTGFDAALVRAIIPLLADRLHVDLSREPDVRFVPWSTRDRKEAILDQPMSGDVDFVISAITSTSRREKEHHITFTDAYFETYQCLLVRAAGGITKPDAARGEALVAQSGTTGEDMAQFLSREVEPITGKDTLNRMVQMVASGRANAAVVDCPLAAQVVGDAYGLLIVPIHDEALLEGYRSTTGSPVPETYAIAVGASQTDLLDALNDALRTLRHNGELSRLTAKFVPGGPQ